MKTTGFKIGITTISAAITFIIISGMFISAEAYKRQSNKENSVRVDVLPVQLQMKKAVKFDIKINTHSVELNNDMIGGILLRDNTGASYNPLKWDGTPPGSHHRSGVLEFPPLTGNPEFVTLIIKDISKVPERIYQWNIE